MSKNKNSFEETIQIITKIYNDVIKKKAKLNKNFSDATIKEMLFSCLDGKSGRTRVIDNKHTFLTVDHLYNMLEKLIDLEDLEPYFYDIPTPKIRSSEFLGGGLAKYLSGSPEEYNMYPKYTKMIFDSLKNEFGNIYADILKNFGIDIFYSKKISTRVKNFYYLTTILSFTGLRYNEINKSEPVDNIEYQRFKGLLEQNDRIIFKGDFRCGKSTFLKYYANKNRTCSFYLDYDDEKSLIPINNRGPIFNTLRPDFIIWDKLAEHYKANGMRCPFKIPSLPTVTETKKTINEKYFEGIPQTDVLIVDHIKDALIINTMEKLPCKVVFVIDSSIDTSEYQLPTFEYDNYETVHKLLSKPSVTEESIQNLYKSNGTDYLLYKVISKANDVYNKKFNDYNLINELSDAKTIYDYIKIFEKKDNGKAPYFSINLEGKSSKGTIVDHIIGIYEKQLGYVDSTTLPDENRKNALYHLYLRILCRLKYDGIDFADIIEYLNFEGLESILNELNWVKNDKIHIPTIVAASFNKKKLNENQFVEGLRARFNIIIELFDEKVYPVNKKVFTAILNCLYEDAEYINNNAATHIKKVKGKPIVDYVFDEKGSLKEVHAYIVNERAIKLTDDKKEAIAMKDQNYMCFLRDALVYSYKYNETELYNKLSQDSVITNFLFYKIWKVFTDKDIYGVVELIESYNLNDIYNDDIALTTIMECYNYHIRSIIIELLKYRLNIVQENDSRILLTAKVLKLNLLKINCSEISQIYFSRHNKIETKHDETLNVYYRSFILIYQNVISAFYKNEISNEFLNQMIEIGKTTPHIPMKENAIIMMILARITKISLESIGHTSKSFLEDFQSIKQSIGDLDMQMQELVAFVETNF